MNKNFQQGQSAYIIPIQKIKYSNHNNINNNNNKNSNKNNQSLPLINIKDDKVNLIRKNIQQGNTQITLMKARINTLKKQKIKNQQQKRKNMQQIQFIKTVRDRMFKDQQYKANYRKKRQSEVQRLHQKATSMRQQMKKERALSKSILNQQKSQCAEQQRRRLRQDQKYIYQLYKLQQEQNRIKAHQIKREQSQHNTRMKLLQQSRLQFAQKNHQSRVMSSLKEKHQVDKTLRSLRKQQDSLVLSVKQAQQEMRQTLYELQTLNPEKKVGMGSRFRSSRTIQLK